MASSVNCSVKDKKNGGNTKMDEELLLKLKEHKEGETVLEAVGRAAKTHPSLVNPEKNDRDRSVNPEGDAIVVEYEGILIYIPREDLEYKPATGSLVRFVGEPLNFVIKEIDEENEIVIGSRREVDTLFRDRLADQMADGEPRKAVIQTLLRFGAYVTIDGHSTLLRNQDFSTDYTAVRDVHQVGDVIEVKLVEYTEDKNLNIEAAEKFYNKDVALALEDLEEGQPILGTVQDITFLEEGHAVFTRIAPGVDAISPTPENIDINVGDTVIFMLTQLNPEENRIRGYIMRKSYSDV